MPTLDELVEQGHILAIDRWLADSSVIEIAEELSRLPKERRAVPFRLLAKDRALEVFEELDPALQQELLDGLRDANVRQLFEQMDPDDRAALVDEVPAKVARRLLGGLSPHERRMTATLLGYPEDSAGRIMSPEVVSLRQTMPAGQAVDKVRRIGHHAETVYALPVTDSSRRLVGMMGLRDLVLADPDTPVSELMDTDVYSVRADTDQEAAARLMLDANLLALPVVDSENRLLGVITVDDAMEILEEEDTEDVARTGGAEPLGRPYFTVSLIQLARSRVLWLLVFLTAGAVTVNVLAAFEETLAAVVTLALFVPLVIGTAGNTGAQSATTITRALAVGEVRLADFGTVVARESSVGLFLGVLLAALAFLPIWFLLPPPLDRHVAAVVSITLILACALASLLGSVLPLVAKRIGVDPAVMSVPLITALIDASGLVIYFLTARFILGI